MALFSSHPNSPATISRRNLIKAGIAFSAFAATRPFELTRAFAQSGKITAVMPGVLLPDSVRSVLEALTPVRIENAPYVSYTDTLAKLLSPGGTSRYDLMISPTAFVRNSVMGEAEGSEHVLPIDLARVANAGSIMPLFEHDIVTRGDRTYLLPVVWGYDSVIYDTERLPPEEADTWGVLFEDRHAGKIAWRDDAHGMIMTAGLFIGIEDPAVMSAGDLDRVTKFLIEKKKNVRTMWSKFGEAVNLIASGEVYAMYGWIPMLDALEKQGVKVANNWPKEGLLTWSHGMFIPKDTPNADAVHEVINALLSPEYGAALIRATRYPPTSTKVAGLLSEEEIRRFNLDIASRGIKTYPLQWPTLMDRWIEAWNTVKSA